MSNPDPITAPAGKIIRLRRWPASAAFWWCEILGWGGLLILFLVTMATSSAQTRPIIYFSISLMFATSFVASLLLRDVLLRLNECISGPKLGLIIAAVVFALGLVLGTLFHIATPLWLPLRDRPPIPLLAFQFCSLLGGWSATYLAIGFYRKHREMAVMHARLESARRDAELRMLKARINPHFLFNSLNSLRALIPRELEKPRAAVTMLADLLRASLSMDQRDLIPLAQELETVNNYLALEQLRLESRLRVSFSISADALRWPVPPFLVQSLVENAVKHGISQREEGGEISVEAAIRSDQLQLKVSNPGHLGPTKDSDGIGLANARARLRHLFGDTACLNVQESSVDVTSAELVVPRPASDQLFP